jgi:exodeoxyribonuclease VII large subunit
VLERGYSITRTDDGRLVRSANEVAAGDVLVTETADGSIRSTVVDGS